MHVLSTVEPTLIPGDDEHDDRLIWLGPDERGVELEVVAIRLPELLLVIHVMPTQYRERKSH
jgi:hypothetical protein